MNVELLSESSRRSMRLLGFFLAAALFFSTFSIAGTQTALAVTFALWIVCALSRRVPRPGRTMLDIPFACFVGASILAAVFSERRLESFEGMRNLLLIVIVYLLGYIVTDRRTGRRLAAVLLLSAAGSAVYGIVIYFIGEGDGGLGRTPGSFSTAMTYGGVLLALASPAFALAIGRDAGRRRRLVASSVFVLAAAALLLSLTRSAWVGMAVSAVVSVALLRRKLVLPLLAGMVLLVFLLPAPLRHRVTTIWDLSYRTNVHRLELMRGGSRIFLDHPVVGVGTRDLAGLYDRYKPPGAVTVFGHMHNIFLQVAVTTGVLGLAAFCFMFVMFFRLLAAVLRLDLPPPERAWAAGSAGAVAGFVASGLFEWNFGDAEVVTLLYIIIGMNLALFRIHRAPE